MCLSRCHPNPDPEPPSRLRGRHTRRVAPPDGIRRLTRRRLPLQPRRTSEGDSPMAQAYVPVGAASSDEGCAQSVYAED